jgi:hypothetical protein
MRKWCHFQHKNEGLEKGYSCHTQHMPEVSGSHAGDCMYIPNNNTFTGKCNGHSEHWGNK